MSRNTVAKALPSPVPSKRKRPPPRTSVPEPAIRPAHPGMDDERLRAVMPTAHDDEQELGP
ncbi:hypothetical protein OG936_11430 [Streptomyces sp. NBC_00846]|uniref:hypothetical protein n=1 Tax=Streptomyces sp. NBC_00846 TaxID=2975849 RepID=UPI003865F9CB|nr:hypothetical protein OG936_11430 [Streptomyces sp. NBC_00846]